jgi:hypothetical protein
MRCRDIFVSLTLLGVGALAQAQEEGAIRLPRAEVALSNDTLQLEYYAPGRRFGDSSAQISASFFLSESRDIVFSGSMLFPTDVEVGRLSFLLGPRAYAALLDEENSDVLSMAVGAQLRFDLNRRNGLALTGHAFYAPDILTFGSADNLTDLMARVEMQLADRLTGFAGMRWFEFDLATGGGEQTLQDEVFVGAGWRF